MQKSLLNSGKQQSGSIYQHATRDHDVKMCGTNRRSQNYIHKITTNIKT